MHTYLIKFTPLEPYFFGNERGFGYGLTENKSYYITSNDAPSQSTILGTLRYCCIEHPSNDFSLGDNDNIGDSSFDLLSQQRQSFGVIKHISPMFLMDANNTCYIPVPYNHKASEMFYTPFKEYKTCMTDRGEQLLPVDYDSKRGVAKGFLQINGRNKGAVESNLINKVVRIGINRNQKEQGMFRKAFCSLKKGYSFSVLAEIDRCMEDHLVCMGKEKSLFRVTFEVLDTLAGKNNYSTMLSTFVNSVIDCVKVYNKMDIQIALSDIYIPSIEDLYDGCMFACVQTRDYRSFKTVYGKKEIRDRYKRGERLQSLIKAGSFFLCRNRNVSVLQKWAKNENFKNCQQIGYNFVVSTAGKIDIKQYL